MVNESDEPVAQQPLPYRHCQNGHDDVCLMARHDKVVCPPDSCDIDDGVRKPPAAQQPEAPTLADDLSAAPEKP